MKKMIFLLVGVAMILHGVSLLPSASAFMVHKTDVFSNQLITRTVECKVHEIVEGNSKTSIKVQNTGEIKAYLRVRVLTYWEDSKGNTVGLPISMPSFNVDTNNWIADSNEHTYYYVLPVEPNEFTEELFASNQKITLATKSEEVNGVVYDYFQVVEIIAEAIQAEGITDTGNIPAVENAWGVTVVDGKITSAP